MTETSIEKFAKGRLSLNSNIVKKEKIEEGDIFLVETKDGKIIYSKIKKEDLKKLRWKK